MLSAWHTDLVEFLLVNCNWFEIKSLLLQSLRHFWIKFTWLYFILFITETVHAIRWRRGRGASTLALLNVKFIIRRNHTALIFLIILVFYWWSNVILWIHDDHATDSFKSHLRRRIRNRYLRIERTHFRCHIRLFLTLLHLRYFFSFVSTLLNLIEFTWRNLIKCYNTLKFLCHSVFRFRRFDSSFGWAVLTSRWWLILECVVLLWFFKWLRRPTDRNRLSKASDLSSIFVPLSWTLGVSHQICKFRHQELGLARRTLLFITRGFILLIVINSSSKHFIYHLNTIINIFRYGRLYRRLLLLFWLSFVGQISILIIHCIMSINFFIDFFLALHGT